MTKSAIDTILSSLLDVQSDARRALLRQGYRPDQIERGETVDPVSNAVLWDGRS